MTKHVDNAKLYFLMVKQVLHDENEIQSNYTLLIKVNYKASD